MKRSLFLLIALLLTTPALGTVTITCVDEGDGVVRIDYYVTGEPNKVRAFALDVSFDGGCAIIDSVTDYDQGDGNKYGIFPGTIDLTDTENPVWNTPVAPSDDPGAEGTGIGTSRVILEMASLYEPNLAGPPDTGTLCKLNCSGTQTCSISISVEPSRGGVVLENGTSVPITSVGCELSIPWVYPDCWGYSGTGYQSQCYADVDGNAYIELADFFALSLFSS